MENSKDVTGMNAGNENKNKSSMGSNQENMKSDKGTMGNSGTSDSTTGSSLTGSGSTLASNPGTNSGSMSGSGSAADITNSTSSGSERDRSDDIISKNEQELERIKSASNQNEAMNQNQSPFDASGSIAAGNSDQSSESRMGRQQMEERGRERMSGMRDRDMSGMRDREGIAGMGESLSRMGDRDRRSDVGDRDLMSDARDRNVSNMGYGDAGRMSESNQYNQYNEEDDMNRSNRGRYGYGDYGQDLTRHRMSGDVDSNSLFDRGSYMRSGYGNYDRSRNFGGSMDNDDRGFGRTMGRRDYNSGMEAGYGNYNPISNRDDRSEYGSYGRNSINSGSDYNRDRSGMSGSRSSSRDSGREDRDMWDKTGDEIKSWFGDDDAQRRRRMDERYDRDDDRNRYGRSSGMMGDRDRSGMSNYRSGSREYSRDDRDAWDRTGDEIKSWFGDDDANRRRMIDERNERERERYDRTMDPDFNRGGYSGRGYGRSRHSSDYYRETDPYSDTSRSSYQPGNRRGSWDYERNRDSDSFGTYGSSRMGSYDPYNQRSSYGPSRSQYDPSDNDYNRGDRSGYRSGRMDIGNSGRYSDRDRDYRGSMDYRNANASTHIRDYDRDRRDYERERDDRDFWDRAGDEVRSWFGDEEAQRRRRMDDRYDHD